MSPPSLELHPATSFSLPLSSRQCLWPAQLFPQDFDRALPVFNHNKVDQLLLRLDYHHAMYSKVCHMDSRRSAMPAGRPAAKAICTIRAPSRTHKCVPPGAAPALAQGLRIALIPNPAAAKAGAALWAAKPMQLGVGLYCAFKY